MTHSNLYLGLVLPSGGWQSLIGDAGDSNKQLLELPASENDSSYLKYDIDNRPLSYKKTVIIAVFSEGEWQWINSSY